MFHAENLATQTTSDKFRNGHLGRLRHVGREAGVHLGRSMLRAEALWNQEVPSMGFMPSLIPPTNAWFARALSQAVGPRSLSEEVREE